MTSRLVTLITLGVILAVAELVQVFCCRQRNAIQAPLGIVFGALVTFYPLPLVLTTMLIALILAQAFRLGSVFFLAVPIAPLALGWWVFPTSISTMIIVSMACMLPPIVGYLLERDMVVAAKGRAGDR